MMNLRNIFEKKRIPSLLKLGVVGAFMFASGCKPEKDFQETFPVDPSSNVLVYSADSTSFSQTNTAKYTGQYDVIANTSLEAVVKNNESESEDKFIAGDESVSGPDPELNSVENPEPAFDSNLSDNQKMDSIDRRPFFSYPHTLG